MSSNNSVRMRQNGAIAAVAFIASTAFAGTAAAQSFPALSFEGKVGVASEYVGKGLGKSDGEIAVSGSAEVSSGDLYASVFASTASVSQGSDAEVITAIGWAPKAAGLAFDFQVMNRDLPGARDGVDENYWEIQADVSRKIGPVSTRLRLNYTPDGFAGTEQAWWTEVQGAMALNDATKATVAVASRRAHGGADYTAWNAGVKRDLTDEIAVDLRWYDTDQHDLGEPYEGRLVAALTYSF